jgi:hypothetical protein
MDPFRFPADKKWGSTTFMWVRGAGRDGEEEKEIFVEK